MSKRWLLAVCCMILATLKFKSDEEWEGHGRESAKIARPF